MSNNSSFGISLAELELIFSNVATMLASRRNGEKDEDEKTACG
jgi:hypothetical protein